MSQDEISAGDVVCLKSDQGKATPQKFTVGSQFTGDEVNIHWYVSGEFKTARVSSSALHKYPSRD